MKWSDIKALLEPFIGLLEPLGEQGVAQLFDGLDAKIATMSQSDFKDAATCLSPALKQFALIELRKLK